MTVAEDGCKPIWCWCSRNRRKPGTALVGEGGVDGQQWGRMRFLKVYCYVIMDWLIIFNLQISSGFLIFLSLYQIHWIDAVVCSSEVWKDVESSSLDLFQWHLPSTDLYPQKQNGNFYLKHICRTHLDITVDKKASPNTPDIVSVLRYDIWRQTQATWLPFTLQKIVHLKMEMKALNICETVFLILNNYMWSMEILVTTKNHWTNLQKHKLSK